MALEVGDGIKSLRMAKEKAPTVERQALCALVENKVGIEMQMQKEMQMQFESTKRERAR